MASLIHVRKFRITVESSLFVGNPCTEIYIPTNVYICICLIFIYKIELATDEITSPRTSKFLATHKHRPPRKKNNSTVELFNVKEYNLFQWLANLFSNIKHLPNNRDDHCRVSASGKELNRELF